MTGVRKMNRSLKNFIMIKILVLGLCILFSTFLARVPAYAKTYYMGHFYQFTYKSKTYEGLLVNHCVNHGAIAVIDSNKPFLTYQPGRNLTEIDDPMRKLAGTLTYRELAKELKSCPGTDRYLNGHDIVVHNRCGKEISITIKFMPAHPETSGVGIWKIGAYEETKLLLNGKRAVTHFKSVAAYAESTDGSLIWKGSDMHEIGGTTYEMFKVIDDEGDHLIKLTCN